jgi:Tfp pilus assembly protein PilX
MKNGGLQQDERGFASLIVGIIMVIILALMTVGFAELMRNELNQVTNRQLSSQAYYAAESGINDAIAAVQNGYTQISTAKAKTGCPALQPGDPDYSVFGKYLGNQSVGADNNSEWTCLLINPNPSALDYNPIDTQTPTIFVATAQNHNSGEASGVGTIDFYWQDASGNSTFQSINGATDNQAYPPSDGSANSWKGTGVLRAAITPLPNNGVGMSRTDLTNNTFTAFLYPADPSHSTQQSTFYQAAGIGSHGATGITVDGNCSTDHTPRFCHGRITVNSGQIAGANDPILFVLRSIYSKTNVEITATSGANGSGDPVDFIGVQTVIDATGRAQDVLKRLQVRIPQQKTNLPYPGFAANGTASICKQLRNLYPNGSVTGCDY